MESNPNDTALAFYPDVYSRCSNGGCKIIQFDTLDEKLFRIIEFYTSVTISWPEPSLDSNWIANIELDGWSGAATKNYTWSSHSVILNTGSFTVKDSTFEPVDPAIIQSARQVGFTYILSFVRPVKLE
jgi:hypothetical protein